MALALEACAQTTTTSPPSQPTLVAPATPSSPPVASAPPVSLANHFFGDGFSFDYPDEWRQISGFQHVGRHGPSVLAAVGLGDFDLGCTASANSVTCGASPHWTVPNDGVVLAYRFDAWLGAIHPQPAPVLTTGDQWVEVAGRAAVLSQSATSMLWHFPGAPEYIEARWGPGDVEKARTEVTAIIAGWTWSQRPIPTPTAAPSQLEPTFPDGPDWPGRPTMTAGDVTVPGAGEGGCWTVAYQERGWGGDSCGPGSFPLDTNPTEVAARATLAIAYPSGAFVTNRTYSGEPVDFSVLASLVGPLRDLPVGQQDQLPTGKTTLDLGGQVGPDGEVFATAPRAPGDYLVQVSGAIRVGDWTWLGVRFYYRLFVK